jgi:Zn-dependent peptidase ImmA (M78 family)
MPVALQNSRWNSLIVRSFWEAVGGRGPEDSVLRVCEAMRKELKRKVPPFQSDRYEYAELVGARVIEKEISNDKLDGVLSKCGNEYLIMVNKADSPGRRSFTVCHEVGHIQILREAEKILGSDRVLSNLSGSVEEEKLSDAFAANLLMPKNEFKAAEIQQRKNAVGPSIESLVELSRQFRTSLEATARRLVDLNIWTSIVLWCKPEKQHSGRTAVRISKILRSKRSSKLPLARGSLVMWGVDCVSEAYNNKSFSSTMVRVRTPGMPTSGEWCLESLYCGDRQSGSVLALMFPKT